MLELRWLAYLGKISYGFYLFHMLVPNPSKTERVVKLFHGHVPAWANVAGVATVFAMTVVVAALSWRFIEAPILRWKDRVPSARIPILSTNTLGLATMGAQGTLTADPRQHEK